MLILFITVYETCLNTESNILIFKNINTHIHQSYLLTTLRLIQRRQTGKTRSEKIMKLDIPS